MRFNTVDEVREAAEKAARHDYEMHKPVHTDPDGTRWQVDLNPYCTQGARGSWQRGFDGKVLVGLAQRPGWDFQYQRGAAAARLSKEKP